MVVNCECERIVSMPLSAFAPLRRELARDLIRSAPPCSLRAGAGRCRPVPRPRPYAHGWRPASLPAAGACPMAHAATPDE